MERRLGVKALLAIAFSAGSLCSQGQALKQTPGSNGTVTPCLRHRHQAGTAHPWIDPYGTRYTAQDE